MKIVYQMKKSEDIRVNILELDYLLEYFPLLKSREKLQQQDVIWKKICQELKWQYIPSI